MIPLLGKVRKVVVGLSGGVDSSVSALLLKKRGYEVVGVFMRNWDGVDETGVCTTDQDCLDAERVANTLDIPFFTVDLVKEYWSEVFQELIEGYRQGLTPNPDILCNSKVKFSHFLRHALENIGCDAIATGHYARNSLQLDSRDGEPHDSNLPARLLKSVDRTKDQTFFLSQMPQKALRRTIFPVGDLPKKVVKEIAKSAGMTCVAERKESMGICFVGKKNAPGGRGFQEFIAEYVEDNPGDFVDIDSGQVIGAHSGIHQWTVGQRCRINRDDCSYFVVSKCPESNVINVASDSSHPALFTENFFTYEPHWISGPPEQLRSKLVERSLEAEFRFQNMSPLTRCVVNYGMRSTSNWECLDQSSLTVSVAEPLRAVTPGQYAAFYLGDQCLGGARISRAGPSLYTLNTKGCRTKLQENFTKASR